MLALLALNAAGALPISAQTPGQVSSTPQGGFVLKANAELVSDQRRRARRQDRRAREGPQAERLQNLRKRQRASRSTPSTLRASTWPTPLQEATVSGLAAGPTGSKAVVVAKPEELRNHRLIVMFFDLTSMQPEDWSAAWTRRKTFSAPRCSPPTWSLWFLSATRSPSTRTLPPTRTH